MELVAGALDLVSTGPTGGNNGVNNGGAQREAMRGVSRLLDSSSLDVRLGRLETLFR
jgi:hypothetical protein